MRERNRKHFVNNFAAHIAGRKNSAPLTPRKFRELKITSPSGAMHLDGEPWPREKKNNGKVRGKIEITVKPAALLIWQPWPRPNAKNEMIGGSSVPRNAITYRLRPGL